MKVLLKSLLSICMSKKKGLKMSFNVRVGNETREASACSQNLKFSLFFKH